MNIPRSFQSTSYSRHYDINTDRVVSHGSFKWVTTVHIILGVALLLFLVYYCIYCNNTEVDNLTINVNQPKHNQNHRQMHKQRVYLYYTSWCPHCARFLPTWEKLKNERKNKELIEVNCSEENNIKVYPQYEDLVIKQVSRYPTIIVQDGENLYEYKGTLNYENLLKLVN